MTTTIIAAPRGPIDHDYYTYLLLRTEDSAKELELKLPDFIDRHMGEMLKVAGIRIRPFLQPLTDIHLHSQLEFEMSANGDIRYVYLFLVITAFVLLLACVNFINLSTAHSVRRAKEVGARKAMGATRFQLICQFLGESTLVALFALFFAVAPQDFRRVVLVTGTGSVYVHGGFSVAVK